MAIKISSLFVLFQVVTCLLFCTCLQLSLQNQAYGSQVEPPPWQPWNVTGPIRLVAICIEFSDIDHSTSASIIQGRLQNMSEYYHNISLGKISIDFNFLGDHWERLNKTMEYYGEDVNGTQDINGFSLIYDSMQAWKRFVNFSDYDSVLVIHAGLDQSYNKNMTQLLWSRNFCYLGPRTSNESVVIDGKILSFWGLAYVSELNEYGVFAHEFGHTLGLPDLYIENENETLAFDRLSLMALGASNGNPEGSWPAPLDGFSMSMLGWLEPAKISLNMTEDTVEMKPLGSNSSTLLKIPLSNSQYYLIEFREKSGYDEYSIDSTSVIVYLIDEMKESKNGIATVLNGGIVTQGSVYADVARNIFVSFISVDSSTHTARVGLSTQLFFVRIDIPNSIECFSTESGEVHVFDADNNPARYVELRITVDQNSPILGVTDENGTAEFQVNFGLNNVGNHTVVITSPSMLAGETETVIVAVFPWQWPVIAVLITALVVFAILHFRQSRKRFGRSFNASVIRQGIYFA
jgi:M6 family metalloprotease-like protein